MNNRPNDSHRGSGGHRSRNNEGRPNRQGRPQQSDDRGQSDRPRYSDRPNRGGRDRQDTQPSLEGDVKRRTQRDIELEIDEDVSPKQLPKEARMRLTTLSKDNADGVAEHLIMSARLLESEPELAYRHAKEAVRRAGRVDVVREALGICAYATERWQEALNEFRTFRRLNGSQEYLPLMADCERGLGRPERAIAIGQTPEARQLTRDGQVELAIVIAGARADLGEGEAGLYMLEKIQLRALDRETQVRLIEARHELKVRLGKASPDDAPTQVPVATDDDSIVVHDMAWGIDFTPDPEEVDAAQAAAEDDEDSDAAPGDSND